MQWYINTLNSKQFNSHNRIRTTAERKFVRRDPFAIYANGDSRSGFVAAYQVPAILSLWNPPPFLFSAS